VANDLTQKQQEIICKMVEREGALPPDQQNKGFEASYYLEPEKIFRIDYQGLLIPTTEATLRVLGQYDYVSLVEGSRRQGIKGGGVIELKHYTGELTQKAFALHDEERGLAKPPKEKPAAKVDTAEPEQLSPHAETILFWLVEREKSLQKFEQSRRFNVVQKTYDLDTFLIFRPAMRPEPSLTVFGDTGTLSELRKLGFIEGGEPKQYNTVDPDLVPIKLTRQAFQYYDQKHGFPEILAEEKLEVVNTKISTEMPEVVTQLKKAYDEIWVDQPEDNWSPVAHICDDALETFAEKVWKPEYADALNEKRPPKNKYVKRLQQTIRKNSEDEELRGLLVKLNDYLDARRHSQQTTRDQAAFELLDYRRDL